MTDYVKRAGVRRVRQGRPRDAIARRVGFAVQTDRTNKFVSINVGIYQHATTIMGSVVGNKEPNGRIQGVAPGARMVSVFYGVSNRARR